MPRRGSAKHDPGGPWLVPFERQLHAELKAHGRRADAETGERCPRETMKRTTSGKSSNHGPPPRRLPAYLPRRVIHPGMDIGLDGVGRGYGAGLNT
jgi:hypothetical protein